MVALGTRAYLGLLENEELVKGHCRIVPIQHHFSSLEADDETWDEIRVRCRDRFLAARSLTQALAELYEDAHADVCRAGQGRHLFRIVHQSQAPEAHLHRSHPRPV